MESLAGEFGIGLRFGILDDSLCFGGHEPTDPQTFFPCSGIGPFGLQWVGRFLQISVVGGDHASLRTVHEHSHPAEIGFELIAEWSDEVGADDARTGSEDFGMEGVVHQSPDRLAFGCDRLNDAHARVIQFGSVVVVGNFSLCFSGGDFEMCGLKLVDCLVQGDGRLIADEVHVLRFPEVFPSSPGKP